MSNLGAKLTGTTGVVIWVSAGEFESESGHYGPRIKVAVGDKLSGESRAEALTVTLTNPPKILGILSPTLKRQIVQFVNLNREHLLKYWRMRIDTEAMLEGVKSIGK